MGGAEGWGRGRGVGRGGVGPGVGAGRVTDRKGGPGWEGLGQGRGGGPGLGTCPGGWLTSEHGDIILVGLVKGVVDNALLIWKTLEDVHAHLREDSHERRPGHPQGPWGPPTHLGHELDPAAGRIVNGVQLLQED